MTKTVGKSSGQETEISRTLMTLFGRCLKDRVWRRAGGFGEHEGVLGAVVVKSPGSVHALGFQKVAIALSYPQGAPLPWVQVH